MVSTAPPFLKKATRFPDIRQSQWAEIIQPYLEAVDQMNKEQARSHRFAMLLQQLFGFEPNFTLRQIAQISAVDEGRASRIGCDTSMRVKNGIQFQGRPPRSPRVHPCPAARERARWASADTRRPPKQCRPAEAGSGHSFASPGPGSSRADRAESGSDR